MAGADYADAEDFTMNRGKSVQSVRLERTTLLDRAALQGASVGHTVDGKPSLLLTFTPEGAGQLANVTKLYLGKQLGVIINGQLLAAPVVRETITGGTLEITGELDEARALKLVEQLNAAIAQGDFVTAPGRPRIPLRWNLPHRGCSHPERWLSFLVRELRRPIRRDLARTPKWLLTVALVHRAADQQIAFGCTKGQALFLRVEFNGERREIRLKTFPPNPRILRPCRRQSAERYQRAPEISRRPPIAERKKISGAYATRWATLQALLPLLTFPCHARHAG